MTDLSNFKKHSKKSTRNTTDGFISAEGFKKQSDFDPDRQLDDAATQDTGQQLDDFDRPDGYHSTVAPITKPVKATQLLSDKPRTRQTHEAPKPHKTKKRRLFRKPKSWRKFFKRTVLVLMAIVLIIGAYLGYKFYQTQRNVLGGGGTAPAICNGEIPLDNLKTEGDSRVNILLLGIGGEGHTAPDLTDTIIVASLDPTNDTIELLSIPRDFWIHIPGNGNAKINETYADGKLASSAKSEEDIQKDALTLVDKTIESVIGIKIHYNAVVNFKAFQDVVDALGGVDVNVSEDNTVYEVLWVENTSRHYELNVKAGQQHFDGIKALYYARSRYTSARGDFDRSERQRLLLVAIKDKVLSLGTFSNPVKVSQLLDSLGNNVYTDFNLADAKCLYEQSSEVPSSSIRSLDLVTPPNDLLTSGSIPGISTLVPKAGTYDYSKIQNYVRNQLKDSFIKKENASVTILNGTNIAGLGSKYAGILKSYGYNVGTTGDAPSQNYQKTVIVAFRGKEKKYTQHYLENRFGVKAVSKLPDSSINQGNADFVIILGTDAIDNSQN